MPNFAHLSAILSCQECGNQVTDMVWFQWGFCRSSLVVDNLIYKLGDTLKWKQSNDMEILSWTYFISKSGKLEGANIGEPTTKHLVLLDPVQGPYFRSKGCPSCNAEIGGVGISVKKNVIQNASIYKPNELTEGTSIYTIESDHLIPVFEWDDHPMNTTYCDNFNLNTVIALDL